MQQSQFLIAVGLVLFCAAGCAEQHVNPVTTDQDLRLTFLHTSDIHSRLLPYDMTVMASDRGLGLLQENAPFGGIARMAHIIQRERARGERVLYVDSGDCFQGAPIFNVFRGEIEQRALSQMRPDAVVIGNHEFDEGLHNLVDHLKDWATYPLLAANYLYVGGNPLGELARPYHIANVGGVRVAFLGIANFSSISSITDIGNSLQILPLENTQILQEYIDFLRPNVDLIVGVSHAGLSEDEEIIRQTEGFDLIFGGHLHVVLNPPKIILDKTGRKVPLVHSGAFAKYVGRLDVVVRNGEVINHKYTLFPIDSTVPEDPTMLTLLEPYKRELQQTIDLTSVFGYASRIIRRFGFGGGDSPLGNFVAEAIRFQARADFGMTNTLGIRTDISEGPITLDSIFNVFPFNNTVATLFISGVDIQALFDYVARRSAGRGCNSQVQVAGIEFTMNCNAPPSEVTCGHKACEPGRPACDGATVVYCNEDGTGFLEERIPCAVFCSQGTCSPTPCLAGAEDYDFCLGNRVHTCTTSGEIIPGQACTTDTGCADGTCQECTPRAENIAIVNCSTAGSHDPAACTREPLQLDAIYEMATNDYIAKGGSGFTILKSNNTQHDTGLSLRDAVLEAFVRSPPCVEECRLPDGRLSLAECATYNGCVQHLTAFHDRKCEQLDLSDQSMEPALRCGHDDQQCDVSEDCLKAREICAGGTCQSCSLTSDCAPDACQGETCRCSQGWCVADRMVCNGGRCALRCETNTDCSSFALANETVQTCIDGGCIPHAASPCLDDKSCNPALLYCYGGGNYCESSENCAADEECVDRRCIPARTPCSNADSCPSGESCLFGYCGTPNPCDDNCTGACIQGECQEICSHCQDDNDCPGQTQCIRNLCAPILSQCRENRCRPVCEEQTKLADDACPVANTCRGEICSPNACFQGQDAKTRCHNQNESLNSERCITISCPRAESDGRIQTIIPKNLEDLPDDLNPDDIE